MAIIQIRDVPEETYEVIRKRARAAGQSIQAYMRAWTIDMAEHPTPDEVIEEIKAARARRPPIKVDVEQLLADKNSGRL